MEFIWKDVNETLACSIGNEKMRCLFLRPEFETFGLNYNIS